MSDVSQVMANVLERFDGQAIADQTESLALLMQELAGVAGAIADAKLRAEVQAHAQRWSSAKAIAGDVMNFHDDTQVLAAKLGDAGLI